MSTFLDTISVVNTRRGYAAALNRMVLDFGADADVALLDPDRVAGWFTFVWRGRSAKTFNTRLTALGSACAYWRKQGWLSGDPLVRLRGGNFGVVTRYLMRSNGVSGADPAKALPRPPKALLSSITFWDWQTMTKAGFTRTLRNFFTLYERHGAANSAYSSLYSPS